MSEIHRTAHLADERESLWIALYKNAFPLVAKFISNRGGTFEQARDIFQDAAVIWYEKRAGGKDFQVGSDKAYLFGIAKNLWYRKSSEQSKLLPLDSQAETAQNEQGNEQLATARLMNLLEISGRKCLELLKAFYYDKLSMTELAEGFGFKSTRSATVQKYKCLERVRETVKQKSWCYEDFFE